MRGTDPTKSTWVYPKLFCKLVYLYTNILICSNYYYILYSYYSIKFYNYIFILSKILTMWRIDVF